jgi:hypothetical protein
MGAAMQAPNDPQGVAQQKKPKAPTPTGFGTGCHEPTRQDGNEHRGPLNRIKGEHAQQRAVCVPVFTARRAGCAGALEQAGEKVSSLRSLNEFEAGPFAGARSSVVAACSCCGILVRSACRPWRTPGTAARHAARTRLRSCRRCRRTVRRWRWRVRCPAPSRRPQAGKWRRNPCSVGCRAPSVLDQPDPGTPLRTESRR